MKSAAYTLLVALALLLPTGCRPAVRPLEPIQSVENGCKHGSPKGPGLMSIMASIADAPPVRVAETTKAVELRYGKAGGVIAHWHDLSLLLPVAAKTDGDAAGYLHIDAAGVDIPADDATQRTVLLHMHGAQGEGWYRANAFDVQNPCIEGSRQT